MTKARAESGDSGGGTPGQQQGLSEKDRGREASRSAMWGLYSMSSLA